MKNFEYIPASSPAGALTSLRQRNNSKALAGGTDLIAEMRSGIIVPDRLVNLKTIPGLNDINFNKKDGLKIGALATLDDIATNPDVKKHFPILVEAISISASPQLRNRATIAGNLCQDPRCWYYRGQFRCWLKNGDTCYARGGENAYHSIFGNSPCHAVHPSDPAPALVTLNAVINIVGGKGERILPLEDLFQHPSESSRRLIKLEPDDLITAINIPSPADGSRGKYIKATERRVWSFALASVAVQVDVDRGKVKDARVVFGGVAAKPWRVQQVEATLRNTGLDDETINEAMRLAGENTRPLSHNGYKVPLIKGILKEALITLRG